MSAKPDPVAVQQLMRDLRWIQDVADDYRDERRDDYEDELEAMWREHDKPRRSVATRPVSRR